MNKKVTQNVTNSNSEDLTELYQKGKLPKGYYYLKKPDGEVMIITPSLRFMVDGYSILAEVPSYEEWQAKLEENTKLKELLKLNNILNKGSKSIYAWLKEDTTGEQKKLCADMFDKTVEMMSEINQVLGE